MNRLIWIILLHATDTSYAARTDSGRFETIYTYKPREITVTNLAGKKSVHFLPSRGDFSEFFLEIRNRYPFAGRMELLHNRELVTESNFQELPEGALLTLIALPRKTIRVKDNLKILIYLDLNNNVIVKSAGTEFNLGRFNSTRVLLSSLEQISFTSFRSAYSSIASFGKIEWAIEKRKYILIGQKTLVSLLTQGYSLANYFGKDRLTID